MTPCHRQHTHSTVLSTMKVVLVLACVLVAGKVSFVFYNLLSIVLVNSIVKQFTFNTQYTFLRSVLFFEKNALFLPSRYIFFSCKCTYRRIKGENRKLIPSNPQFIVLLRKKMFTLYINKYYM